VILQALPWSSLASFAPDSDGTVRVRSLRGNHRYDVYGFRSANAFRNHSFAVHDVAERSKAFGVQSDDVPGRDYAVNVGTLPFAGARAEAPQDGPENLIRLHYGQLVGNGGVLRSGSAGCLVSPRYYEMRAALVAAFRQELKDLELPDDDALRQVAQALTHDDAKKLYPDVGDAGWTGKVAAELFLVRPGERPLVAVGDLTRWVD
jgi:hypothetical protein